MSENPPNHCGSPAPLVEGNWIMANQTHIECTSCHYLNSLTAEVCVACGKALPKVHLGQFEEQQEDFELPIEGFKGDPEEIERQWYERVYTGRGDRMKQLTLRAVLMGSVLGGILSLTNIYIGLKAGWGFGVAITACILSYAIWTTFYKIGLVRTPMTILENNCMQSTASSAGYSTGGTLISAFAAYILLNNQTLPIPLMMAWVFFLAVLGVTMAIPMKRQMINVEQLRFPSGIAAAETLRALHSHGAAGMRSAKALGLAGLIAAFNKFLSEGLALISHTLAPYQTSAWMGTINTKVLGATWVSRTVSFAWDPLFIAAGAITGLRVCASMLLGGILCWMIYVPILQRNGLLAYDAPYREMVQWTLWGGTSCMVTSGLLSFFMQWRSIVRSFSGLGKLLKRSDREADEMAAIETPVSWFILAQLVSLIAIAWLAHHSFGMPYWQSVLAVLMTFALALVACRVTGETDTTPIGAMGKIMQLTFGVLHPASKVGATSAMNVNLMAANITAGAAGASADLLTDLKSGYLLGANPRKQFIAQFCGIFTGTVVTVLAFSLLVPNASVLGTEQFPAPAAQTWRGVAEAMSHMDQGLFKSLGPIKTWAIIIGGIVGIILPILGFLAPPKVKPWIPSAAGVGLAWVFQFYYALLFFIGSILGFFFEKKWPAAAKEYTFPVASGIIAGDALMGVALIFWENGPEMLKQMFGG
jgi:OPT family oligopeptide transporter